MRHADVFDRLVTALREVPAVVAVGAYGSTAMRTWTEHSDIDLVAVLDHTPPAESVRFFVDAVAVDLNLRAADHTDHGIGGASFVPEMVAVWDPDGVLSQARSTRRAHDPAATRPTRYLLFHDIEKARQVEDPGLARIAIAAGSAQVLRAWFQAREEPFPGMVDALRRLRSEQPELLDLLNQALLAQSGGVDLLAEAAELALAPEGGAFKPGEVMVVEWVPSLPSSGLPELLAVLELSDPPRTYR